jgi:hypothetical protein
MVLTCKDNGEEFGSSSEYKRHHQTHLQTHLDKWSSKSKPDKVGWKPPEGMTQDLFKVFEKYGLGKRARIWVNGQLQSVSLHVFWKCRIGSTNGRLIVVLSALSILWTSKCDDSVKV